MKYIKIFIILIIFICITGCRKKYELYIDDNAVTEKFHLELNSDNKYAYILDGDFYPLHNDFDHTFQKKLDTKGNKKILDINYTYTYADFANANSFNQCFDEREISFKDDNYFSIKLSKPNGCMFGEDYTINIITDKKVLSNNADKVNGNRYIWYVKNKNKDKFRLDIKIEKNELIDSKKNNSFIGYIVLGLLLLASIFAIYFTLKIRKKNSNI